MKRGISERACPPDRARRRRLRVVRPDRADGRLRLQLHRPLDPDDPRAVHPEGPRPQRRPDRPVVGDGVRAVLRAVRPRARAAGRYVGADVDDRARPVDLVGDDRAVGLRDELRHACGRPRRRRRRRGEREPRRLFAARRLVPARETRDRPRRLFERHLHRRGPQHLLQRAGRRALGEGLCPWRRAVRPDRVAGGVPDHRHPRAGARRARPDPARAAARAGRRPADQGPARAAPVRQDVRRDGHDPAAVHRLHPAPRRGERRRDPRQPAGDAARRRRGGRPDAVDRQPRTRRQAQDTGDRRRHRDHRQCDPVGGDGDRHLRRVCMVAVAQPSATSRSMPSSGGRRRCCC